MGLSGIGYEALHGALDYMLCRLRSAKYRVTKHRIPRYRYRHCQGSQRIAFKRISSPLFTLMLQNLKMMLCTCLRVWPTPSASMSMFNPQPSSSTANNTQTTTMLPDEIITQLTSEFSCREQQIQHLAALYSVCRLVNTMVCISNKPDTSSFTTICQRPRFDSYRQIVNSMFIFSAY